MQTDTVQTDTVQTDTVQTDTVQTVRHPRYLLGMPTFGKTILSLPFLSVRRGVLATKSMCERWNKLKTNRFVWKFGLAYKLRYSIRTQ